MSDEINVELDGDSILTQVSLELDWVSSTSMQIGVNSHGAPCCSLEYTTTRGIGQKAWKSLAQQHGNIISGLTANGSANVGVRAKASENDTTYITSGFTAVLRTNGAILNSVSQYDVNSADKVLTLEYIAPKNGLKIELAVMNGSDTLFTVPITASSTTVSTTANVPLTEAQNNALVGVLNGGDSATVTYKLITYSKYAIDGVSTQTLIKTSPEVDAVKTGTIIRSGTPDIPDEPEIPDTPELYVTVKNYHEGVVSTVGNDHTFVGGISKLMIETAEMVNGVLTPATVGNDDEIISISIVVGSLNRTFDYDDIEEYDADLFPTILLNRTESMGINGTGRIFSVSQNGKTFYRIYLGEISNLLISGEDSLSVKVTITNTNNESLSKTWDFPVYPYSPPTITNCSVSRTNGAGTSASIYLEGKVSPLIIDGNDLTQVSGIVSWFDNNDNCYVSVHIIPTLTEDNKAIYETFALLTTGEPTMAITPENVSELANFDDSNEFNITFYLSDGITTVRDDATLSVSSILVALRKDKIGINKLDPEKALDVKGDIGATGTFYSNTGGENVFAAIEHERWNKGVGFNKVAFGCGVVHSNIPSVAMELRDNHYAGIIARLDVYQAPMEIENENRPAVAVRFYKDTNAVNMNIVACEGTFYFYNSSLAANVPMANIFAENIVFNYKDNYQDLGALIRSLESRIQALENR